MQPSSGLQPLSSDEVSMPFQEGEILSGKYEVMKLIGAGGMGFVVAAMHVELGEKVALKFLRPEALANEELVGRFAREARASAKIKSEHVARVFDVGNLPDGAPFIVMEHLEGKDLGAVITEQGALPVKVAVEYVLQACEALATAHANGIVHRDVKPENLFLTHRAQGMDVIKVLDFGISKVALTGSAFESRYPMVRTMMPMGSPIYMSPEQIRASNDIDARTDIWSLGCVLYELLTGNCAFDAPSLTQVTAIILEQEPHPLHDVCPTIPPGLEAVVQRCLSKDPARRYRDVGELAVALYPFGPRRGRVSAERCCFVLRSAGMSQVEFELPSVSPPAHPGVTTGVRSSPELSTPAAVSTEAAAAVVAPAPRKTWVIAVALAAVVLIASIVFAVGRASAPSSAEAPPSARSPSQALAAVPNEPAVPASPAGASLKPTTGAAMATAVPPAPVAAVSLATATATVKPRVAAPAPPRPRANATPSARPTSSAAREADIGF